MSLFARRTDPFQAGGDFQATAALRLDGVRKKALETGRARLVTTAFVFLAAFGLIAARMVDVAVLDRNPAKPHPLPEAKTQALDMERADIVDRNGTILATSLPTVSLYAKAPEILDAREAADKLVSVLPDLARQEVMDRLISGKSFVYLRRNLTPRQQYDVNALGIPGLYFEKGERRVYPHGNLVAHIVGMTDIDNKGIAGIEKRFEAAMRSGAEPVRLSLDTRIQTAMRDELARSMKEFAAAGAIGTVMDVRTGEVVAMVSLPDFDPNDPPPPGTEAMFNRATKGAYEMGSTFKLFNTAMALDLGIANPNTVYDAHSPMHFGSHRITDPHPLNRPLTVTEILIHSSNIGSARMALDAGTANQRAFLGKMGMLSPAPFELPEMGGPLVPTPWRDINTVTISYGHGLSVTPLHLMAGVSALVNGGEYHTPTLLAQDAGAPVPGRRVVKERTSAALRQMMRQVVTEGTGSKADVPGYLVGGKTGTAEKPVNGSYRKKAVLSSFIAAFPMDEPRYAVLVMIDEPRGTKETHGSITGGWTAAPAAGRIIAQIAPLTGMLPRRERQAPGVKGNTNGTGSRELAAVE